MPSVDRGFIHRRTLLKGGLLTLLAGPSSFAQAMSNWSKSRIPIIHATDLYHPPQDPDDQIDLATVAALREFDLKAVILDSTQRFLVPKPEGWDIAREPGFMPVRQMGHILGTDIPVAAGPVYPLEHPGDKALPGEGEDDSGIRLLLDVLRESSEPVVITAVGSARVITAAYNREPELMLKKTRAVVLNAGSTGGPKKEWNVGLDTHAFVGLMRSRLPVHWYPCGTERSAFVRKHERGTYWKVPHAVLFKDLPQRLRAYLEYGFTHSSEKDGLAALDSLGHGPAWEKILEGERNMWSTASLVMAAGRVLARTEKGWRFLAGTEQGDVETWPWRLDPVSVDVSDDGKVDWSPGPESARVRLFGRQPDIEFGDAMAEALNALLREID
ncbi:MAG: hypothetical protein AB3N33_12480 [Puniceicoccaceae bacterium]